MATEMKNGSHSDAADLQQASGSDPQFDLDPQSLAAIRALLATEPAVEAQPVAERQLAKAQAAVAPVPRELTTPRAPRQVAALTPAAPSEPAQPKKTAEAEKPPSKLALAASAFLARTKATVLGYRPSAKHVILGCLALLVVFRPLLVLGILLLNLFIMTVIFLILGYDGFWRRGMALARWYARRRPARSAELHRKLDTFAMKWDAVLDRFPEGSVDGLYLPDFGDLADADARHDAALSRRFDSLRENKV